MVGGTWKADLCDQSFLDLQKGIDLAKVVRSTNMFEMVVWDPAAVKKVPMTVCSVPTETNHAGTGASLRAAWYMLDLLGRILEESGNFIRGITFDAHGSHALIRRVLHGHLDSVKEDDLTKLGFWKDLTWKDLPQVNLPRLPIRICLHKNEPIYAIPGCCHSSPYYTTFL